MEECHRYGGESRRMKDESMLVNLVPEIDGELKESVLNTGCSSPEDVLSRLTKKRDQSVKSRVCSICSEARAISEFYRKGNRLDSACKVCQREKKKAKYVAAKECDVMVGLQNILSITKCGLVEAIYSEIKKLDEVILCRQKQKQ